MTTSSAYELLYDEQGAFVGLRAHQTTYSPAGLASLTGLLRQVEAERDELRQQLAERDEPQLSLAEATSPTTTTPVPDNATSLAWVRRYGQHPPSCGAARGMGCSCGLDELRSAL